MFAQTSLIFSSFFKQVINQEKNTEQKVALIPPDKFNVLCKLLCNTTLFFLRQRKITTTLVSFPWGSFSSQLFELFRNDVKVVHFHGGG